jgi:hypothetical protein
MSEPNLLFEIDGFPKYFVGTNLNIYSEKSGYMRKMKGCINGQGYYSVELCKDGKRYTRKVHRFIAEMFIPNPDNLSEVDHINHNRTDNRLENLRWVTPKDNGRNQSMRIDNTSGHQGVSFDKRQNSWKAQWYDNQGKQKSKYFSINKYGDTQAKQLAIDIRNKMVDDLYNRPT